MKRFYKEASVGDVDGGYAILLDGRSVKTPAKSVLTVPTKALAEAMAAEWEAQVEDVNPDAMPLTRHANTALDRVSEQRNLVVGEVSGFGATDLVCYRAAYPSELVTTEAEGWDPVLAWLEKTHGITLNVAQGVVAVEQPDEALSALKVLVGGYDDFALAALHTATHILGSVVLALALFDGELSDEQAWGLSRMDEDYQERQWGGDAEATKVGERRRQALFSAHAFFSLHQHAN
ncbi:MAG: ATPase [Sphingomonadales bacterium]|nr:ATPase [Sphingomonadales bacterium]